MTRGFLLGMARMLEVPVRWRYLITLQVDTILPQPYTIQNDDIPLKTNGEMVQILTALNGSNDLRVTVANADRIPAGFDWTYRALRIFRNEDRYGTMESTVVDLKSIVFR